MALRPTHRVADIGPKIDLEAMIPQAFGDWHEEKQSSAQIVDPRTKEMLDKLYSQTLTRTYVNTRGYRIMLSIAYGEDQSDGRQVHKPEVCYPAQGFTLKDKQFGVLQTAYRAIPVIRILTSLGERIEPVTYWVTVGTVVVRGGVEKKLAEMRYGLNGEIPDGMLFRISSIDAQVDEAYVKQAQFASELLDQLTSANRQRLIGAL